MILICNNVSNLLRFIKGKSACRGGGAENHGNCSPKEMTENNGKRSPEEMAQRMLRAVILVRGYKE